jgi:outer membrane protein OmpA-like peptidoglycan-associated protein
MKSQMITAAALSLALVGFTSACASKKYVRNRINERVTPLEQRTGELEETSRRNSQDIARVNEGLSDVRGRVERAQAQADTALTRAKEAEARAGNAEQAVNDLRSNLDRYSLEKTAVVNFKFDSYELTPAAKATLDELAMQIKDRSNFILEIEGFADATGTSTYNDLLTEKRADAVRRYLAEVHNIPLFRMFILGFGKNRPVADNRTKIGRAQNRRVEVRLLTRSLASFPSERTASNERH